MSDAAGGHGHGHGHSYGDGDRLPAGIDVDAAALLGDDAAAFEAALESDSDPVAVRGPPFAGRATVLDRAADRLGASPVRLGPDTDPGTALSAVGDGPAVIGGCHHLYDRTIGGFDPLERFLDRLAAVDAPVVTGWNRYAWSYLAAVRDADRGFPVGVDVGPASADRIADLVLEWDDDPPRLLPDEGPDRLVTVRRYTPVWGERSAPVRIPVPVPTSLLSGGAPGHADAVFERLATVSGGNVGVAAALWERLGDEVRPDDVRAPEPDGLDREEAFLLRIVLETERASRAELADVAVGDVDRLLDRLDRAGLVADGDTVSIVPAAVPAAVVAGERWGIP